jgi:hypothetical protein
MQLFKRNLVNITETNKKQKDPTFSIKVESRSAALNLLMGLIILFPQLSIQGMDKVTGRNYKYGVDDIEIGEYITFGLSDAFDVAIASKKPSGFIIPQIEYNEDYIEAKLDDFYKYVTEARKRYPQNEVGTVANTMLKADGIIPTKAKTPVKKEQPKPKVTVTADWIYLEDQGIYVNKYHDDLVTVSKTTTYNLGEVKDTVIHFI